MFFEEFEAASNAAKAKAKMLKENKIGYFMLTLLAGMFIGFGILLIFSIGGLLNGAPATKVVMGASFGIALSLVAMAGAELFTGNNFIMSAGLFKKKVTFVEVLKVWIVCFIGNWLGSILIAVIYHLTGLGNGAVGKFIATGAMGKMSPDFIQLFTRGLLCNILVCLAIWCGVKCKTESGKLIMIFWCLFAFITTGFEHSIANMTLFTVAILNPAGQAVSMGGYLHNILAVTLGNMIGGILFVAVPYYLASLKKGE